MAIREMCVHTQYRRQERIQRWLSPRLNVPQTKYVNVLEQALVEAESRMRHFKRLHYSTNIHSAEQI